PGSAPAGGGGAPGRAGPGGALGGSGGAVVGAGGAAAAGTVSGGLGFEAGACWAGRFRLAITPRPTIANTPSKTSFKQPFKSVLLSWTGAMGTWGSSCSAPAPARSLRRHRLHRRLSHHRDG